MLSVLQLQWDDYIQAYKFDGGVGDDLSMISMVGIDQMVTNSANQTVNIYNDGLEENTTGSQSPDWASKAALGWDMSFSVVRRDNIRNLTNSATFTRESLLDAWAEQEASVGHWGARGHNFRITGGAADSKMSLGFSQIQSRWIYGTESGMNGVFCTPLRAQDINMMHPRDSLAGFVHWTANRNCGESFLQAFNVNVQSYDENYDNSVTQDKILRARYGTNNQVLLLQNNILNDFTETDYERLTKGIAGYNQGFSATTWSAFSLPEALKRLNNLNYSGTNDASKCRNYSSRSSDLLRCLGYLYAISVKSNAKANLPLASYLWRTQVISNGAMQEVCFYYGEDDWADHRSWEDQRDYIPARITCPTP